MRSWALPKIESRKKDIKILLDQVEEKQGRAARLEYALIKIKELSSSVGAANARDRYIYVMSALVQHLRYGGLKPRECKTLLNLAFAILEANDIDPSASRLAFLYGDVHLLKAQLAQKDGNFWQAAWETQISKKLARRSVNQSFQYLSLGLRSLRTGNLRLARSWLGKELDAASGDLDLRRMLGLLQVARISGEKKEALDLERRLFSEPDLTSRFRREVEWERICRLNGPLRFATMIDAVENKEHNTIEFQLEALLWAYASQSYDGIKTLKSSNSYLRKARGDQRGQINPSLRDAVRLLEGSYDARIPLPFRLRALESLKRLCDAQTTIDKEMLLWLAAARWLDRSKSPDLATLALEEYRSLSLRCSAGTSYDVLNLSGPMQDRLAGEDKAS